MTRVDLERFAELFRAYTELRVHENRTVTINLVNGNVTENARSASGGVSARAYAGGCWGFASSPEVTDESIRKVVKEATSNATFLDVRERRGNPRLQAVAVKADNDFSTRKPRLTQRQLLDFLREVDAEATRICPGLASRTVALSCLDMEKTLVTSDGTCAHSMIPRSQIRVVLTVEKDGSPVELMEIYGGFGQFEDAFESPADLRGGIERQYEHLRKKSEGVHPDAGVKTCVLDAELAGILAHEAIGHTCEADLVLGGSVAGEAVGRQVASPLVTLVDFANTALGQRCPVPVYVDDEGTSAQDAVLIEAGVLKGFLHNKETALRFGTEPRGNARAFLFSDEPLIRMRNTAIMPGSSTLEEMIASVDDGYYLMKPSNGQADLTSEFMFGVTLGYEIKGGKLGRAIKDTTISGVAFDMLKTVTMVSRDMKWMSFGMCGKKQPIPVGMGGPAIKCQVRIGGR